MDFIIYAVIVLGAIALIAAVVLYAASKKFAVQEDPRIGQVLEALPGVTAVVADSPDVRVWQTHW